MCFFRRRIFLYFFHKATRVQQENDGQKTADVKGHFYFQTSSRLAGLHLSFKNHISPSAPSLWPEGFIYIYIRNKTFFLALSSHNGAALGVILKWQLSNELNLVPHLQTDLLVKVKPSFLITEEYFFQCSALLISSEILPKLKTGQNLPAPLRNILSCLYQNKWKTAFCDAGFVSLGFFNILFCFHNW